MFLRQKGCDSARSIPQVGEGPGIALPFRVRVGWHGKAYSWLVWDYFSLRIDELVDILERLISQTKRLGLPKSAGEIRGRHDVDRVVSTAKAW